MSEATDAQLLEQLKKGDAKAIEQLLARHEKKICRLFTLPPGTRLLVGHDYPPSGRTWEASTPSARLRQRAADRCHGAGGLRHPPHRPR